MLFFDTSGENKVHIRYFALVAAAPSGFIMVSHARNGADPWLSSDIYGNLSADLFSFDSSSFQITSANAIAVDTWHQIDVSIDTRSGQEEARFWLDGVLVGSLDSNDLAGGVIGRLEFGIILVPNGGNVPREVFIDDVVVTRESPLDLP